MTLVYERIIVNVVDFVFLMGQIICYFLGLCILFCKLTFTRVYLHAKGSLHFNTRLHSITEVYTLTLGCIFKNTSRSPSIEPTSIISRI